MERANLLNQDNTLFLNVNTQLLNSAGTSSSQMNAPPRTKEAEAIVADEISSNIHSKSNMPQTEVASTVSLPRIGSTISSASNKDQTEFLHYIDIMKVLSSFKNIVTESGNRGRQLDIETTLQHQCNGSNRIIVKGEALKSIMKLTHKEWEAVLSTLSAVETFQFESKDSVPVNGSLLHRTLYYLLRASSKISNIYITYGDHDLETARIFDKPNYSNENVTSAINPFILSKMKSKINEMEKTD